MRRREFITITGGAALTWPLAARAEAPPKRQVIAWLTMFTAPKPPPTFIQDFLQGLEERSYIKGQNFEFVFRSADGHQDRVPAIVEEFVRLRTDVILAGATFEAVVIKKATSTVPIVCPALADAVHLGLVESESRPGGNLTGIEPYVTGLPGKQIELARELMPRANKIGLLTSLEDPKAPPQLKEMEAACRTLDIKVVAANVSRPEDIDDVLRGLAAEKVDLVIVLETNLLVLNCRQIASTALAERLPTLYGYREHVVAGGLISYGVNLPWCYRRAAYFVDRILHGTPPRDLPVEFPNQLLLSINRKTADALGLAVPPTLLARADEVIE
jgi:putative tryptophan/tyrosine transport system substrate-binding protein